MKQYLNNKTILVVEDDRELVEQLKTTLTNDKAIVEVASSVEQALEYLANNKPHLVLLDRHLEQHRDGIEVLEHIRYTPNLENIAVIMLTAKDQEDDQELAYKLEADEYITKPFKFSDLKRRLVAILRRTNLLLTQKVQLEDGVFFNIDDRELIIEDRVLKLSPTDYKIMLTFCERRGRTITRHNFVNYIWDENQEVDANTIRVSIYRLRSSLGKFSYLIKTIKGAGYKLIPMEETQHWSKYQNKSVQEESAALAGSIAHEVRTPLAIIASLVDVIQEKNAKKQLTADDVYEISEMMRSTAQDGNYVIDLILSNISNKEIDKTEFYPLSVAQVIKETIALYPFKEGEKERVFIDIAQDFNIIGSNSLLRYLLINLLKNAIYYFESLPEMTINITLISRQDVNKLIFTDTGIGITEDKIANLFDNFTTSGKKEGTGLGLSFCKRVMESFDGDISCQSTPDEYTTFTLSFPVQDIALPEPSIPEQIPVHDLEYFNDKIILIADDQPMMRMLLKTSLKYTQGLQIYFAENGQEAVKQVLDNDPDLILTDLNMPLLEGEELIDSLRQAASEHATIISLSAENIKDSIATKVDDSLVKPVQKSQLLEILHKYLD